jgi:hypothetical protein
VFDCRFLWSWCFPGLDKSEKAVPFSQTTQGGLSFNIWCMPQMLDKLHSFAQFMLDCFLLLTTSVLTSLPLRDIVKALNESVRASRACWTGGIALATVLAAVLLFRKRTCLAFL